MAYEPVKWKTCGTCMEMYPYLSDWEKKYVNLKAKGIGDKAAVEQINPPKRNMCITEKSKRYVRLMHDEAAVVLAEENAENVMTMVERRKFLADLVRTPVGSVTKDSKLAQEHTLKYDNSGNLISETIKVPSKLDAIELDAKLAGDLSNGGQVVVPVSLNFTSIMAALPDTTGIPSARAGTKVEVGEAQKVAEAREDQETLE